MKMEGARIAQIISAVFLCILFFGGWGFLAGAYNFFPASILKPVSDEVVDFVVGGEGEQTTLTDKILHDFFGAQTRLAGHAAIDTLYDLELSPVADPHNLLERTKSEIYYHAGEGASGYYYFATVLRFGNSVFSGALVSAEGELLRLYKQPKPDYEFTDLPDHNHGGMTDDGYVVLNPYKRFLVYDFCGTKVFEKSTEGWHHDISGGDGIIWAWQNTDGVKLDAVSGEELRRFSMLEVIAANDDLSIFEPRLIKSPFKGSIGQWKYDDIRSGKVEELEQISLYDPFHENDIDVLTQERASLFPMFSAGDLLLSFRSINLVVAIDPDSLKVKWYTFGQFSRQHDPDWSPTGEITLYDNQSHNFNSRVLSFDPHASDARVILDGSKHGLFKFAKGSHHVDAQEGVLVDNLAEMAHFSAGGDVQFYVKVTSGDRDMATGAVRHITQAEFDRMNAACH